jgi:hypothetical protein
MAHKDKPSHLSVSPVLPPSYVTPGMLAALAQAIAGGVTDVQYGDRRISYMSLADLLRAFKWIAGQLGVDTVERPRRRLACFSKGLNGPGATSCGGAGLEHDEYGPDYLWSRQVPGAPGRAADIDWEQR